jgi:hypothetical protein
VMFRAAPDQEQQSNISWTVVDKNGMAWTTHANRKQAWAVQDKNFCQWPVHSERKWSWADLECW